MEIMTKKATDKLKVMLSFMREINDGIIPSAADYDLSNSEFWDIVEACQDEELIKGATCVAGGNTVVLFIDNVKLTVKGLEYLHKNSKLMKTYKGLKEIRDWMPF